MSFLYTLLVAALSPVILLSFAWKYGLRKTAAGLPERLGMGAGPGGKSFPKGWLWVHAASVGEVKAAEPFLRALPARFPGRGRLLTTTTVAGQELAERLGLAECVRLAPIDLPVCVSRLLDRWSPAAAVLVETELWPQWLRGLARRGVPAVVVNGRVSDRAFPRYMRLQLFWEPLLAGLARVGVQSPAHASRFLQLGAAPERVVITGNIKFDAPAPDLSRRDGVKGRFGYLPSDLVWVCGSTHPGEEGPLLEAFAVLKRKGVRLLWAPRHAERAGAAVAAAKDRGFSTVLRSQGGDGRAEVLVLDTVGELSDAYGCAAFAFVGGSLVLRGGQNPLEPARWGVPVLFGPSMENFAEMSAQLAAEGGAVLVRDGASLAREAAAWLEDPARLELAGRAARRFAESQRGAVEASLTLLSEALNAPAGGAGCCHG